MIGVAVIALACAGVGSLTRAECLDAMVINSTGSAITDVQITCFGSIRRLGNLSPWQAYSFGRHAYGWTQMTVSYVDGHGQRISATRRIGVDLRQPVRTDGDSGQAVIDIEPTVVTAERRYWVW